MNPKLKAGLAAAAIVITTAGVAWAQTPGRDDGATRNLRTTGDAAVFVPISPCRVVDTRLAGGPLQPKEERVYQTYGSGSVFLAQGGKAGGCGISQQSIAVEASVTAVGPKGNGYFRAWPNGETEPNATFLNYTAGQSITNTGAISISRTEPQDLRVQNRDGVTNYVIDIQGYYENITGP